MKCVLQKTAFERLSFNLYTILLLSPIPIKFHAHVGQRWFLCLTLLNCSLQFHPLITALWLKRESGIKAHKGPWYHRVNCFKTSANLTWNRFERPIVVFLRKERGQIRRVSGHHDQSKETPGESERLATGRSRMTIDSQGKSDDGKIPKAVVKGETLFVSLRQFAT